MLADDTVGQILMDIDSPGGSVYGVAELGDEILSARAQKPVVAVANSLAASAAYWIGCSASEFYVTPGGEVGSIGVWQAHQDYSKALEEELGSRPRSSRQASSRSRAIPMHRWTKRRKDLCSPALMTITTHFTKAVAKGRGVPITRCATAWARVGCWALMRRLAQNMVDGIATFDDVLSQDAKDAASSAKSSPPAIPASRLAQARSELGIL